MPIEFNNGFAFDSAFDNILELQIFSLGTKYDPDLVWKLVDHSSQLCIVGRFDVGTKVIVSAKISCDATVFLSSLARLASFMSRARCIWKGTRHTRVVLVLGRIIQSAGIQIDSSS